MEFYFAPMEGVTGGLYRTAHSHHFPGIDCYYMPFITPTQDHVFTPRELRNVAPEYNQGFRAVPQILTKNSEDFNWAARELFAMGYDEVNLNLGCPSGTVTAKGKGAGMLADPEGLDRFLDTIYGRAEGKISLKTRLGMEEPTEFGCLLEIFRKYPVHLMIIHPRVRQDFYKHPVRMDAFDQALEQYSAPVCFNGGLVTAKDCAQFRKNYPQVNHIMIGQGLLANPALVSQAKGVGSPERDTLRAFHDELYHSYLEAFGSQRNTVFHMKEFWNYLSRLFEGAEKPLKQIRKAAESRSYEDAVEQIFRHCKLRQDASWE